MQLDSNRFSAGMQQQIVTRGGGGGCFVDRTIDNLFYVSTELDIPASNSIQCSGAYVNIRMTEHPDLQTLPIGTTSTEKRVSTLLMQKIRNIVPKSMMTKFFTDHFIPVINPVEC